MTLSITERPLVTTLVVFLAVVVFEVLVIWLGFSYLPSGSLLAFCLLMAPVGGTVLLALYSISATTRRVLRGQTPWYFILSAVALLGVTLVFALLAFYFFVFALFGFS